MNRAEIIQRLHDAFRVLGIDAGVQISQPDPGLWEINILAGPLGSYQYYAIQDVRERTAISLLGQRRWNQKEWVVSIIVQMDGSYWDPPYEDEREVATHQDLVVALIDATMNEVQYRMLNAAAPYPELPLDYAEDIPR